MYTFTYIYTCIHILWLGYHTGSPSTPRTCKAQSERNFSPWQRPQVSGDEMANARPAIWGRLVLNAPCAIANGGQATVSLPPLHLKGALSLQLLNWTAHDGNTHWKENCGLWWTWRIPYLVSEHHCNALEFTTYTYTYIYIYIYICTGLCRYYCPGVWYPSYIPSKNL